jgi:hypothetical protein
MKKYLPLIAASLIGLGAAAALSPIAFAQTTPSNSYSVPGPTVMGKVDGSITLQNIPFAPGAGASAVIATTQSVAAGYLPLTGGTVTGSLATTGNVSVQGNLSSTANTQPAGPTNSGVSLGGSPTYAFIGMYDQSLTANNRTSQIIFLSGQTQFRLANDASSATANWLVASGGYASGITGITSNSGSGTWAHTGAFSATSNITGFNVVANGGSVYAGGAPSTPLNVTTQSSVQLFTGGAANQSTIALINSTNSANNRSAYSQWAGGNFVIAGFANDAFTGGVPILQAQGGFATGITGILSSSGTGSWTHTGNMAVSGHDHGRQRNPQRLFRQRRSCYDSPCSDWHRYPRIGCRYCYIHQQCCF